MSVQAMQNGSRPIPTAPPVKSLLACGGGTVNSQVDPRGAAVLLVAVGWSGATSGPNASSSIGTTPGDAPSPPSLTDDTPTRTISAIVVTATAVTAATADHLRKAGFQNSAKARKGMRSQARLGA